MGMRCLRLDRAWSEVIRQADSRCEGRFRKASMRQIPSLAVSEGACEGRFLPFLATICEPGCAIAYPCVLLDSGTVQHGWNQHETKLGRNSRGHQTVEICY